MSPPTHQTRLDRIASWYKPNQWGLYTTIVAMQYRSFQPFFQPGPALEIGPADGAMTQLLVNDFPQLEILDAAPAYVSAVTAKYPQVIGHTAYIESFTPAHRYRTIIFSHVLEHVAHPIAILKRLRQLYLASNGQLLLTVPNALSLHRQVGVAMGLLTQPTTLTPADRHIGHRRVYTPAHLKRHLATAGFHLRHFGGVMLKPLSAGQIQAQWSPQLIEGYYQVGLGYPHLCAELFVVATPKKA